MMSRLGVSSIESEERILTVLDEFHSIFAAEQLVAERARARAHVRAQARGRAALDCGRPVRLA